MSEHAETWRQYYEKSMRRKHNPRTEFAVRLNESNAKVAVDCGCGTGADIAYFEQVAYQVFAFDVNPDSVDICKERFASKALVDIECASFDSFAFPRAGVITANSSLFFAHAATFLQMWKRLTDSLEIGGVFAGDFMGVKDTWVEAYRSDITPFTEVEVRALFAGFDIVRFTERDEDGTTAIGKEKHWHVFSVVAIKRESK